MSNDLPVSETIQKRSYLWLLPVFLLIIVIILEAFYLSAKKKQLARKPQPEVGVELVEEEVSQKGKKFIWGANPDDSVFKWGVSRETFSEQERALFYGYVTAEPAPDSEGLYFFKMAVELDSDQRVEIKVLLGKEDWSLSGFEAPEGKVIESMKWEILSVRGVVRKIKKGNQIAVRVVLSASESITTPSPGASLLPAQEKYKLSQAMEEKNNQITTDLLQGRIPVTEVEIGPVNTLMF